MKPLLAHIYEPHRVTYPVYLQPKLNGVRALYQNGCFQSREQLPWHPGLLVHLAVELQRVFPATTILDGELYKYGWPLQRINGAISVARKKPISDTEEIEYHIFDRVEFSETFASRFASVQEKALEFEGTKIKIVTTVRCPEPIDADILYAKWVSEGYEGCMYRVGDCPYTVPKQDFWSCHTQHATESHLPKGRAKFLSDKDNRAWHLLKRKDWQDCECEYLYTVEGEGKRRGMVGSFVVGLEVIGFGQVQFHVGSGLTDAEALHYFNNPPIGRKIKVKYLCLTAANVPFNPTIEAIL